MADFTAADVKKLRDLTGAGMMDCKKALEETDGDFDEAVEVLRIKGAAKAAKRGAERTAANGLVAADGGAMIELNCETDFVAKNAAVPGAGAPRSWRPRPRPSRPTSRPSRPLALPDGRTVAEAVEALSAVIGEKLELSRSSSSTARSRPTCTARTPTCPPRSASWWPTPATATTPPARAAMQIAAMRPQYVTRDEVPAEVVETERRDRRGDRPRGGQARGRPAEDRRGPGQRLLQGRRADSSSRRCRTARRPWRRCWPRPA